MSTVKIKSGITKREIVYILKLAKELMNGNHREKLDGYAKIEGADMEVADSLESKGVLKIKKLGDFDKATFTAKGKIVYSEKKKRANKNMKKK